MRAIVGIACTLVLVAVSMAQEVVCEDGVCRVIESSSDTDWSTAEVRRFPGYEVAAHAMGEQSVAQIVSLAEGRASNEAFDAMLVRRPLLVGLGVAFVGGILLNFTPCVLPLIPVTLLLLGLRGGEGTERRRRGMGLAYGLGIAFSYGALGMLSTGAGLAFGTVQSSPWFSAVVAGLMLGLALAMWGVFSVDLSRYRPRKRGVASSPVAAFAAGMGFALLAGACVAPVVLETLLAASLWPAAVAWTLPLALGLGMGAPWMLLGESLPRLLPKPGAWMHWVNRAFGLVAILFAVYYGFLAWRGWHPQYATTESADAQGVVWLTDPEDAFLEAELQEKPIFVDLWATWCRSCTAMEQGPLRSAEVVAALEGTIPLRLQVEDPNVPEAVSLFRELGFTTVRGLPAFALLRKADLDFEKKESEKEDLGLFERPSTW